jgi:hypothetical protein
MKTFGFKKSGLLVLTAAIIVSACGPVSPSVSKFSDSSDPSPGESGTVQASSSGPSLSIGNDAFQTVSSSPRKIISVVPYPSFKEYWSDNQPGKAVMQVQAEALDEFMKNNEAMFSSNSDQIRGHESVLATSRVRIIFIVDTDKNTIKAKQLRNIQANLKWNASQGWNLKVQKPSELPGDPSADTHGERIWNDLRAHLVGIALEFWPNATQTLNSN